MKLNSIMLSIGLLTFSSLSVADGLQSQMDDLYIQMSNYTQPGSFETARRGGFQGGRFTVKQGIVRNSIVNVQLPSARGGCGGIDIFGGSFSFINSDQIVETFRAVAANAEGYAFQLALKAVCKDCATAMNDLQQKIQNLNENMLDSCQLAQGVVNGTVDAANGKLEWSQVNAAVKDGIVEDTMGVYKGIKDVTTAFGKQFSADPVKTADLYLGAVLYKHLQKTNYKTSVNGGDDELIETLMTIIGSPHYIAATAAEKTPDDQGDRAVSRPLPPLQNPQQLLRALISETKTSIDIYNCSADTKNCISPTTKTIEYTGLAAKIYDHFLGSNGIITNIKLRNKTESYDTSVKNILAGLPNHLTNRVVNLANCSPSLAEDFVKNNLRSIAIQFTDNIVTELLQSITTSSAKMEEPYRTEMLQYAKEANANWGKAVESLDKESTSQINIEVDYKAKMEIALSTCPEFHFNNNKKLQQGF